MTIWYKLALLCGVFPLVAGLSILFLWWESPSSSLETAGLVNIFLGLLLFLIGCTFLVKHHLSKGQSVRKVSLLFPLLLLLLNFPVAVASVYAALVKYSESSITIKNDSPHTVEEIAIQQRAGSAYGIKDVGPEETYTETVRFKYESDVTYSMKINGGEVSGVLFGYVTPSMGSHARVVVSATGIVKVEEKF